jgi:hypothetical protein
MATPAEKKLQKILQAEEILIKEITLVRQRIAKIRLCNKLLMRERFMAERGREMVSKVIFIIKIVTFLCRCQVYFSILLSFRLASKSKKKIFFKELLHEIEAMRSTKKKSEKKSI